MENRVGKVLIPRLRMRTVYGHYLNVISRFSSLFYSFYENHGIYQGRSNADGKHPYKTNTKGSY